MKTVALALLLVAHSVVGHAQSESNSPYIFGGACGSQGAWTQQALMMTQNLKKVTTQLRDNPACKSLGQDVEKSVAEIQAVIQGAADTNKRVLRLSSIPQEVSALRAFVDANPSMQKKVMRMMMDRSIEGATLSAQVQDAAALPMGNDRVTNMMNSLSDFGTRLRRSVMTGSALLNHVVESIPKIYGCLDDENQAVLGTFIGTAVQLAAALSDSGQDATGKQIASTITKLSTIAREKRYAEVWRRLSQQEFLASMACLTELTSESFCKAREAAGLFQKGMESLNDVAKRSEAAGDKATKADAADGALNPRHPFAGYYILNTHVPNITKWLQKVQIGVDPKLPTDADFQQNILQEVTDFYNNIKEMLGNYNKEVITIQGLPTLDAKQLAAIKLIMKISENMSNTKQNATNFFTLVRNPLEFPFALVGINQLPSEVSGAEIRRVSPFDWFNLNRNNLPIFKDPVALLNTVNTNMQVLIQQANVYVIDYFNRWYVPDKQALAVEALVDINTNVKESMIAVKRYLDELKERIVRYDGEMTLIATIEDTQSALKEVLRMWADLDAIGRKMATAPPGTVSAADLQKAQDTFVALINGVYDKFMLMSAKSGFLANRMVNLVYYDYILLLKKDVDFSPYHRDLFIATRMGAFDRLLQMHEGNTTAVQADLNMALKINKGNLQALEILLRDQITANIAEMKMVMEGQKIDNVTVPANSAKRTQLDSIRNGSGLKFANPTMILVDAFKGIARWPFNMQRYPLLARDGGKVSAPESEFRESRGLYDQLCILSLAFVDQYSLKNLCAGAVLKSPILPNDKYDVSYNVKINEHMNDRKLSKQMQASMNHSERICAYHDYNMKNMVLFWSVKAPANSLTAPGQ